MGFGVGLDFGLGFRLGLGLESGLGLRLGLGLGVGQGLRLCLGLELARLVRGRGGGVKSLLFTLFHNLTFLNPNSDSFSNPNHMPRISMRG